jgi:hypothetical protein
MNNQRPPNTNLIIPGIIILVAGLTFFGIANMCFGSNERSSGYGFLIAGCVFAVLGISVALMSVKGIGVHVQNLWENFFEKAGNYFRLFLLSLIFYAIILIPSVILFSYWSDRHFDSYRHHGAGVNDQMIIPGRSAVLFFDFGKTSPGGACLMENPRIVAECEGRTYECTGISGHPDISNYRRGSASDLPWDKKTVVTYKQDESDKDARGNVSFNLPNDEALWGKRLTLTCEADAAVASIVEIASKNQPGKFVWVSAGVKRQSTFYNFVPRDIYEHSVIFTKIFIAVMCVGFVVCVLVIRKSVFKNFSKKLEAT